MQLTSPYANQREQCIIIYNLYYYCFNYSTAQVPEIFIYKLLQHSTSNVAVFPTEVSIC